MRKFIEKFNIQIKLLLALTIGLVVLSTVFYFFIPMILNYPEGTYGTVFQVELENTNYFSQVLLISVSIFLIFSIITFSRTSFLVKYSDLIKNPENYSEDEINFVKDKLFRVPYSLFVLDILVPSVALTFIHAVTINQLSITTLKLFILVITFVTIYVIAIFIYTNGLFKDILIKLPITDTSKLKHFSIQKRIFFHILPLVFVSVLFMALLGYVKLATEKGNSLFEISNKILYYFCTYNDFSSLDDLIEKSDELELPYQDHIFFIRFSNGTYINRNKKEINFSAFFTKYLNELSNQNSGRVYEYYGVDCQAATYTVDLNGEDIIIGIYFKILSTDILSYFFIAFLILFLINVIILTLFSNSLSYDINIISDRFTSMSKETDLNSLNQLSITSNDEIGNLCIAYNTIQSINKNNQDMLIEKERLASLGQMIGRNCSQLKNTDILNIWGCRGIK